MKKLIHKCKRWISYAIYYGLLQHFPHSNVPFLGRISQLLRYYIVRNLVTHSNGFFNVHKKANFCWGQSIKIGNNSDLGANCWIRADLDIGDNVMMAKDCIIYGRNHHFESLDIPIIYQGMNNYKKIIISDNVWIGARVTILPGVKIGEGVVIGAGSVVTRDILDNSIVAGNPAKIIGKRSAKS